MNFEAVFKSDVASFQSCKCDIGCRRGDSQESLLNRFSNFRSRAALGVVLGLVLRNISHRYVTTGVGKTFKVVVMLLANKSI